jgi:type 1 glutamine amidotransferase
LLEHICISHYTATVSAVIAQKSRRAAGSRAAGTGGAGRERARGRDGHPFGRRRQRVQRSWCRATWNSLELVMLMALFMVSGQDAGARAEAVGQPVRVLFVLGSPPPHDIVKLPPILEGLLRQVGGFSVTRLEPPAGKPGDSAHIARLAELSHRDTDVVIFYTVGMELGPAQEKALQAFVEDGGGLVAIHGASASFGNSAVWTRLIGARFAGHAPGLYPLPVEIVDRQHPITAGVADFVVTDEEYCHTFPDGVERHVIARFRERPANSKDPNGNRDVAWTREAGKGRVFYTALGHDEQSWSNPAWQRMMVQGILWSAGRRRAVTLPAAPK